MHARLAALPAHGIGGGAVVLEAATFASRLAGLARLRSSDLPEAHALILRPCSSIHTFAMRFPLDVAFARADGELLTVIRGVPPRRLRACRHAQLALECHAGEIDRFLDGAGARLSPRIPRAARA